VGRKKKPVSAEEFAAWREDPVTAWVMGELEKAADSQLDAWVAASWVHGEADPLKLAQLRTRADAYVALSDMSYEDLCSIDDRIAEKVE
jgi:hypothetical protein